MEHFNLLKSTLKERDELIQDTPIAEENSTFWSIAANNYPNFRNLLPLDDDFSLSWIDSLYYFYDENFICGVEISLSRNKYLNNRKLTKIFSLEELTSECTELKIKKDADCLLFDFFRKDDYDLEVFDILYELYINGAYSIYEEADFIEK